jgi:Flp pilus assembly protein TadD
VIVSLLLLVPVVFLILFARHFYRSGREQGINEGIKQARSEAAREGVEWPTQTETELNAAMNELRRGDAAAALQKLRGLESSQPPVSSLSYLVALTAMQDGDIDLADRKARESIDKLERISDSLALLSVLESQKAADPSRKVFGDPSMRSEALLRQAILADAANPYPHFELATLLRYRGRKDEAMAEIQAAQARLNPVDSHLIMAVTLALMKIEETPVAELPMVAPVTDDPARLFPAAYVAMRREDFAQAAALLQKCRDLLAPDVFSYLVTDPVLRLFSDRPELAPFYGG